MAFLRAAGRCAGALLLAFALTAGSGPTTASELTEAQAKAALLYNFAGFVEWPPGVSARGLVIGVAGDADVFEALRSVNGTTINGHEISVRSISDGDEPSRCQVLYLPAVRERASTAHLRRVAASPVLTVGDSATFMRDGGIVRIFFEGARLRFEVSLPNAERARLRISSKVLGLARRVQTGGTP
jgi:uncharacterized protein DUF4154